MQAPNVVIGVTTYAGSVQTRLILRKALRHLRCRLGPEAFVTVISDGHLDKRHLQGYVDLVISRRGPSGLQGGELESVRWLINISRLLGAAYLIKTCGDVILDMRGWDNYFLKLMCSQGKRMLSTHWFDDNSGIVGTKFFAGEVRFLEEVWPKELNDECLELALTRSISALYRVADVVHLINSETGEKNEVRNELRSAGWEHAHRVYKFKQIDTDASAGERFVNRLVIYPVFRVLNLLRRSMP